MIDIHIVKDESELSKVVKIREEVFIKGQNVPAEIEVDGLDNSSEHAILYLDEKAVGTARIRYQDNKMKLQRIAILEEARGNGLGKQLMEFLIQYGKDKNVKELYMHAQYYLLDFYSKLGFKPRGETFEEAGIKHIEMYMEN